MNERAVGLLERIKALEGELQEELETELAQGRKRLLYHIERNRIRFEQEVLDHHRRLKVGLVRFFATAHPLNIATAPVVYSLAIPFLALDLWISIYQAVCFPMYGIEHVRRSDYFIIDRHHLRYLNAVEKLNCFYCSYTNGLIAYVREIAGRTEQYWCPIKHARRVKAPHGHYDRFVPYGDAQAYRDELERLRAELAKREKAR